MATIDAPQLRNLAASAAFAFRGYNVENLGRTDELLAHPAFGSIVASYLRRAGEICGDSVGRRVDLVARVRSREETTLETYDEAASLIVAAELAQLEILQEFFGISYRNGRVAFGYSLGEPAALVASGVLGMEDMLMTPLSMAADAVELAQNVTMGVLFSRGPALPLATVQRLCIEINQEGKGVIGVSTYLSPNSLLLLGQFNTVGRFKEKMTGLMPPKTHLRENDNHWPPLHTPIMWEKAIPNRAAVRMHTIQGGFTAPQPPILSMVTGTTSYNEFNCRELLHRWIDHPLRMWDVVYETLAMGIETVVHVGPQPNIIPATYKRLRDNVAAQTQGSIGMRALQAAACRPWLKAILPERTALLRAPQVRHVILEDWLIEQPPL